MKTGLKTGFLLNKKKQEIVCSLETGVLLMYYPKKFNIYMDYILHVK